VGIAHPDPAAGARVKPAVFVDRDGTLNEMVYDPDHGILDSPFTPDRLVLRPGAARFVAGLNRAGLDVIVVTNQPGLAKGTLTPARLDAIHQRLAELLMSEGARIDAIYHCPHHPSGAAGGDPRFVRECECRKPGPGLLLRAASDRDLDLARSVMVGDGAVDVAAGRAAGVRTVLVGPMKLEALVLLDRHAGGRPDVWVASLDEALQAVLSGQLPREGPAIPARS
jgi:D-glycero-D-manno-heptose 1,7-bisphosphate phosphatase